MASVLASPLALLAETVALVVGDDAAAHEPVVTETQRLLTAHFSDRFQSKIIPAHELAATLAQPAKADAPHAVVTFGANAARVAASLNVSGAVLNADIPRGTYEKLAAAHSNPARRSAIYREQLVARQLALIKSVAPKSLNIGVIYGAESTGLSKQLEQVAATLGLVLVAETVRRVEDLGPALRRVLKRSDCFLALPDAEIMNTQTMHQVLRAGYHGGRLVFGFSPEQIKSGAIAVIFSTPAQSARQIVDFISTVKMGQKMQLPAPHHPLYFRVNVNRDVARSFDLSLPANEKLERIISDVVEGG